MWKLALKRRKVISLVVMAIIPLSARADGPISYDEFDPVARLLAGSAASLDSTDVQPIVTCSAARAPSCEGTCDGPLNLCVSYTRGSGLGSCQCLYRGCGRENDQSCAGICRNPDEMCYSGDICRCGPKRKCGLQDKLCGGSCPPPVKSGDPVKSCLTVFKQKYSPVSTCDCFSPKEFCSAMGGLPCEKGNSFVCCKEGKTCDVDTDGEGPTCRDSNPCAGKPAESKICGDICCEPPTECTYDYQNGLSVRTCKDRKLGPCASSPPDWFTCGSGASTKCCAPWESCISDQTGTANCSAINPPCHPLLEKWCKGQCIPVEQDCM